MYIVRMFCIAFTKSEDNQIKNTCLAKTVQVMSDLGTKGDLKSLVKKLISAHIGEQIERDASGNFPNKYIRKVKVLKI